MSNMSHSYKVNDFTLRNDNIGPSCPGTFVKEVVHNGNVCALMAIQIDNGNNENHLDELYLIII